MDESMDYGWIDGGWIWIGAQYYLNLFFTVHYESNLNFFHVITRVESFFNKHKSELNSRKTLMHQIHCRPCRCRGQFARIRARNGFNFIIMIIILFLSFYGNPKHDYSSSAW